MNANTDENEKPATMFVVSDEAETLLIKVQAPGVFGLKIKSNPTTGYSWIPQTQENKGPVKFKKAMMEEEFEDTPPKLGAPSYEILIFEALEPGETTVNLHYKRPWEKDAKPIKTHKVIITVI